MKAVGSKKMAIHLTFGRVCGNFFEGNSTRDACGEKKRDGHDASQLSPPREMITD